MTARRDRSYRVTIISALLLASVLYGLPPIIAMLLKMQKGHGGDSTLVVFGAMYALPPALVAIAVGVFRRAWPLLLVLPTALLSLVLALIMQDAMAKAYGLALLLLVFAAVRSVQWRGLGRQAAKA